MHIDPATMLVYDMTPEERSEVLSVMDDLVVHGIVPPPGRYAWLEEWVEFFGYTADHRLLMLSTAIPQRMLLSVARSQAAELVDLKKGGCQ